MESEAFEWKFVWAGRINSKRKKVSKNYVLTLKTSYILLVLIISGYDRVCKIHIQTLQAETKNYCINEAN